MDGGAYIVLSAAPCRRPMWSIPPCKSKKASAMNATRTMGRRLQQHVEQVRLRYPQTAEKTDMTLCLPSRAIALPHGPLTRWARMPMETRNPSTQEKPHWRADTDSFHHHRHIGTLNGRETASGKAVHKKSNIWGTLATFPLSRCTF